MTLLEAIRQRVERATKGPWVKDISPEAWAGSDPKSIWTPEGIVADITWQEHERHEADADFIAYARSDLPALLSVVNAALRVRDEMGYHPAGLGREAMDALNDALATLLESVEKSE